MHYFHAKRFVFSGLVQLEFQIFRIRQVLNISPVSGGMPPPLPALDFATARNQEGGCINYDNEF
jgi:hypothetical protein